jgi:CheY-like chemotaxis protein
MFDERGIYYDIASNGRICVEMLKMNINKTCCGIRYRLVFTDIQMPVLTGYKASLEMNKIIKELNGRKDPGLGFVSGKVSVPIIAMSAFPAECILNKLGIYGLTDYIEKPFP